MVKNSTLFTTTSTLKTISSSTADDFSHFGLVYGKRILDLQSKYRHDCSAMRCYPRDNVVWHAARRTYLQSSRTV